VVFTAFLVQPDRPSGTSRPEVLDRHLQGGIYAGEAVGERRDQGAVAKVPERHGRNGIEQRPPFGTVEYRCFAGLYDVRWPAQTVLLAGRDRAWVPALEDLPLNFGPATFKRARI